MPPSMPVRRDGGPFTAPAGRIGAIQMRHDLTGAAVTGDPAEIMLAVFLAETGVGGQRRQAIGGHTAGNRVRGGAVAVTGGQRLTAVPHAIRELHTAAASIAEAPMPTVAFDFKTSG